MYYFFQNLNSRLTRYVHSTGDDKETLLLKKIWLMFHVVGLPFLLLGSFIIADHAGIGVVVCNVFFALLLLLGPLVFHFHKKGIEEFALITQVGIVLISVVKVYFMGGLLHAGGPVFIGLMGPIYALTLPNKRRAVLVFLLYSGLMTATTLLQPRLVPAYLVSHYFLGFFTAITLLFLALLYFNWQVGKMKQEKEKQMQELDEFKTRFYTNITHEFRTPLTIILGMAEQLADGEAVKMIKRNGRKLLNLTNQMLNLSKLEANAMPVNLVQDDVVAYLKYLSESFHSLAEAKNIHLGFSAQPEIIKMDFDPEKMQDIVSNLLSNAIKFTPENGQVQIAVRKQGGQLVLTVKDTGVGISEEHLPQIFDRYFQSGGNGSLTEGTGLGLALTRELVKLLHGKITVETNPGKGSVFTVRLPVTNQAKEAQVSRSQEEAPLDLVFEKSEKAALGSAHKVGEKLVLLLVEDNPDVLHYLRSLLAADYQIEEAGNGREGFEKALEIIPDLIISDVMMPEMDGFTFCKKLKNDLRTSHIPVVLLTAKADADSRLEGLEAGADAYLAKPFNKEELFVRVKKLIKLRRTLQERYASLQDSPASFPENGIFQKEDAFLQEVRSLLLEHLDDEEFGIAGLCSSLGMSRSQLYRKFRALTDTTVHHFIRNLRLSKARELLLSTDLNVTEVAFETGFKNLSHFSKIFMEKFGESPSHYRQKQLLDD